jgi:hypothetical protein
MVVVDGWGYAWRGVDGSLMVDAGASLAACVLLTFFLLRRRRNKSRGNAAHPVS